MHRKSPFLIEYLGLDPDGAERRLTSTGERRAAWFAVEGEGSFVAEQLSLGVGELIYGLGERFTPFVKNGQSVDIWNEDGGTSQRAGLQEHPFLPVQPRLRPAREPSRQSLLRGGLRAGLARVQFSVPGEELEYFLIYGPEPKEVLAKYARLAGRPALPPAWSFGLWLTTSFTTDYDEKTVIGFIDGMASAGHPSAGLPLRLLLDEGVPLVRSRVGRAVVSRSRRPCSRASRTRA